MFRALNCIIENEVEYTYLDGYSVIIGTRPSQGARSPHLWNKVYDFEKKKIRMVPLDVKEENLEHLFFYLNKDKRCLGGAVAVPYKEKLFDFIKNNVRQEIKDIGAINCFYRPTTMPSIDQFTGTNTDGEAALEPILQYLEKNENLSIALLGFGGAGKAIFSFLLRDFKKKHRIQIFNRSPVNIKDAKKNNINICSLDELDTYLPQIDLLINTTSLGHIENSHETPVSVQLLKQAKKTLLVYDIIYDPIKTKLLKTSQELGLKTINGLRMNIIQAVFAYSHTNKTSLSVEEIYNIMN